MTTHHTGTYVEHTGHVLAAFSSVANPSGKFTEDQKSAILAKGIRVRLLSPPPPRVPFLLAAPRRMFRLDYPVQRFHAELGEDLIFTVIGDPDWLKFDATSVSFMGEPPINELGNKPKITVTARQNVDEDGLSKSEKFQLKILSPPFAINGNESFFLPPEQLNVFSAEISADIVRRPRGYQFQNNAFVLLQHPADRRKLTFGLKPGQLVVRFQSGEPVADKEMPIWALVRRPDEVVQINLGTIPKNGSSGSIGFTLNSTTTYQILLLVSGYDPFFATMNVNDPEIEWPTPIP